MHGENTELPVRADKREYGLAALGVGGGLLEEIGWQDHGKAEKKNQVIFLQPIMKDMVACHLKKWCTIKPWNSFKCLCTE